MMLCLPVVAGRGRTAPRWLVVARNEGIFLDEELTLVVVDAVAALISFWYERYIGGGVQSRPLEVCGKATRQGKEANFSLFLIETKCPRKKYQNTSSPPRRMGCALDNREFGKRFDLIWQSKSSKDERAGTTPQPQECKTTQEMAVYSS